MPLTPVILTILSAKTEFNERIPFNWSEIFSEALCGMPGCIRTSIFVNFWSDIFSEALCGMPGCSEPLCGMAGCIRNLDFCEFLERNFQ